MWIARAALVLIAILLSACASGPRVVDALVRTHAAQPPGVAVLQGAHYRFERAPARVGQPAPERLLALAQAALARVGAVRDDAGARVSVQVDGTINAYWRGPWHEPGNPRVTLGLGVGHAWRGGAIGLGWGWPMGGDSVPAYASEVSLLMRDLQSGQIVYDTRARHDGPWHDTDAVLAALFVAALEGYPQPAASERRVAVPLLPPAAAASAATPAQP
ncbi:MAG: hypothetical protein LCH72_12340 [Proteobacteria bacterium]|nr:hypothetical protein [Pseudomonadota bacterium]